MTGMCLDGRQHTSSRLLCDEMLAALARWLRAAGHDTVLASGGADDDELIALCRREDRVLLTRDRRLAERQDWPRILRLEAEDLDGQAGELKAALDLDWLAAPFTRCMVDNAPLVELDARALGDLPVSARRLPGPFRTCPACGRRYWPGSHAKRISHRLETWASRA